MRTPDNRIKWEVISLPDKQHLMWNPTQRLDRINFELKPNLRDKITPPRTYDYQLVAEPASSFLLEFTNLSLHHAFIRILLEGFSPFGEQYQTFDSGPGYLLLPSKRRKPQSRLRVRHWDDVNTTPFQFGILPEDYSVQERSPNPNSISFAIFYDVFKEALPNFSVQLALHVLEELTHDGQLQIREIVKNVFLKERAEPDLIYEITY